MMLLRIHEGAALCWDIKCLGGRWTSYHPQLEDVIDGAARARRGTGLLLTVTNQRSFSSSLRGTLPTSSHLTSVPSDRATSLTTASSVLTMHLLVSSGICSAVTCTSSRTRHPDCCGRQKLHQSSATTLWGRLKMRRPDDRGSPDGRAKGRGGMLEPISADFGRQAGYTLDWSPKTCRGQ
ncbi:uncharacterized protein LOC129186631 [Dunckerocampus dactyliophorus]|uniref:uncharacterized protein LOC129186631 n=1 Tax=Dunckerocampus dactyliophorus TaxID=161453 RepID=UPI0024068291|nr:uncharacterized protein LOC129186631 [Dunckerocampus dactyliophorus]